MLSSFKEILLNLVIKRITNRFFMFKNLQTKSQLNKGRRFLKLNNQENILDLYYNKHLKQKDIANIVGVSKQYVSKVVNSDSRCKKEKQLRKDKNAITRKDYMKGYFKNYVRSKKEDNSYEQLKALQYQDSLELSYFSSYMNDYAFAKYNSSIYHRDKNGNLRLSKGIKVCNDVPKIINMNIPITTQKYKNLTRLSN